jgi:hypothetical protein
VELELVLRPRAEDDLHPLLEARAHLVEVEVEPRDLLEVDAAPEAVLQAPVREQVEHRRLLRQAQRLVEGHDVDHDAEPDPLGSGGEGSHHQVRRREQVVAREVVLGEEDAVVSELLRE